MAIIKLCSQNSSAQFAGRTLGLIREPMPVHAQRRRQIREGDREVGGRGRWMAVAAKVVRGSGGAIRGRRREDGEKREVRLSSEVVEEVLLRRDIYCSQTKTPGVFMSSYMEPRSFASAVYLKTLNSILFKTLVF